MEKKVPRKISQVSVGMSACGLAAGADEIFRVLTDEVKRRNLPVEIKKSGCIGMCFAEPLVEVRVDGLPAVTYGRVTRDLAIEILERHIAAKNLISDYIYLVK